MFLNKYIRIRPQTPSKRIRQVREIQKLQSDEEKLGYFIAAEPDYKQAPAGYYPMLAGVPVGPLQEDPLEAYKFAVLHKVVLIDQFTNLVKNKATEAK